MTELLTSTAPGQLAGWLDGEVTTDRDLAPGELRLLAERIGNEPALWRPHVRHDAHERYTVLLHRREHLDVWLLCWREVQETGLHDHDRSAGALHVCEGALVEDVLRFNSSSTLGSARRKLDAGTSRGLRRRPRSRRAKSTAPGRQPRSTSTPRPYAGWGTTSSAAEASAASSAPTTTGRWSSDGHGEPCAQATRTRRLAAVRDQDQDAATRASRRRRRPDPRACARRSRGRTRSRPHAVRQRLDRPH